MHVTDKGAGDGEADASAIGVFIELNELGEDILGLLRGDADAGVFDDKEGFTFMDADAQHDIGDIGLPVLESHGMSELNGIVEQEGEGLDGTLLVGDEGLGFSLWRHLQLELQVGGILDATGLDGLLGDVGRCDCVVALDVGIIVYHAEVEHLIDQLRDALTVLYNLMTDGLQLIATDIDIGGGEHLTEA